ncbi:LLM class flavin-dependent oxidoreductase [Candidatus Poriferisodalis sp.]|uniref:LLM class flavin-dependent oxidoreductase n=1 Tax=Candidatus Poriferisodalis sp. TaxID=3101277 RepID=UPI003C703120
MSGSTTRTQEFPELGFYMLAGEADQSADALTQVQAAEELGLGRAFLGERPNRKEAGAICGAAAAATNSIGITLGVTNINTRHPLLTAGLALTVQNLAGGRFVMGIGRGVAAAQDMMGLKPVTTAEMEEFALLMRRLFRGEIRAT